LTDAGAAPRPRLADSGSGAIGTSTSTITCIHSAGSQALPAGESPVATVHFTVTGTGVSEQILSNVQSADADASPLVVCNADAAPPAKPVFSGGAPCTGVTVQIGASAATATTTATAVATGTPTITAIPGTPTSLAFVTRSQRELLVGDSFRNTP
jgi:hypothetical protein